MRRYYFAWIFCPDRKRVVLSTVNSKGATTSDIVSHGVLRANRWGMVEANTASAARDAFRDDEEVTWFS